MFRKRAWRFQLALKAAPLFYLHVSERSGLDLSPKPGVAMRQRASVALQHENLFTFR